MYCTARLNFDGQTSQLHHFGQAEPDGDRPDVLRRCGPVRKDIARVPDAPALAEEKRRDRLRVHLVRVGPAVLAADKPPLLWKDAEEELLREVAHHHTGSGLPLSLAVNSDVAVGKMKVGPAPRTQLPECAGDNNSTRARSPSRIPRR